MSPETEEHKKIKEIVLENLKATYGSGLKEYPDSGNIDDVFVMTSDGIAIFVENVWASNKNNFYRDLNILRNSEANVKIFIVNPEILKDNKLQREYEKAIISERKRGRAISNLIDGSRILTDPNFVDSNFSTIVKKLISEARKVGLPSKKRPEERLKHSKRILLTRSDYQGLDQWASDNLMENLLLHAKNSLETSCLMQHFETGYHDELWIPLIEYQKLIEKYDYPTVPCPKFRGVDYGYEISLIESFERIPEKDRKRLLELKKQFLQTLDATIFGVQNGVPLKGWCDFCSQDNHV